MKRNEKLILLAYGLLAITILSVVFYFDSFYYEKHPEKMKSPFSIIFPNIYNDSVVKLLHFSETDLDKKLVFETFTDVENYPKIFPKNIISIKIINQTDTKIIAEEVIMEKGIRAKFLVQHEIEPYSLHRIKILEGDAKNTTITQYFGNPMSGTGTGIETEIELRFSGILSPLVLVPKNNMIHAGDTITNTFLDYAIGFESEFYKTVDEMYREILYRPADSEGLEYYGSMLETGKMTIDEIRNSLNSSAEKKSLLDPMEWIITENLKEESKKLIEELYLEILYRPADSEGLEYYGSMLETGKMTIDEIRNSLNSSAEKNILSP